MGGKVMKHQPASEYREEIHIKSSVMYALLYQRGAEVDDRKVPIVTDVEYTPRNMRHVVTRKSMYRLSGQWCRLWTMVNGHENADCIIDAPIEITGVTIKADKLYTYGPAISNLRWGKAKEIQAAIKRYSSVMECITGELPSNLPYARATLFQFGNTEVKLSNQRFIHCQGHDSAIELFDAMVDLAEYLAEEDHSRGTV